MRRNPFLFLSLISILLLSLQITVVLASDIDFAVSIDELPNCYPDKKRHLEWEDSGFDPLRIDFNCIKEKNLISEEEKGCINTIKNRLKEKGISGIVFGRGSLDSKVLIDNHVFASADELKFANDQGDWVPIYPGRSVILLEVAKEKGVFLISGKEEDGDEEETENKFEIVWEDFFRF